jgi:hypothetical protein
MSSLAELPELIGFFSYSREDDDGSFGGLSALRDRIQHELRGQLGRTAKTFRLWQDKEAIAPGTLWKAEIETAVSQSAFFIPIITPTVVASKFCRFELEAFLAREAALGRNDLVFPILYIDVPALEDAVRRQNDPVLSLIAQRMYVDWREFRHLDVNSTEVKRQVGRFCTHIRDALYRPWMSPEERKQREELAAQQQAEAERHHHEAEDKRRAEEEARQRRAEEEKQEREAEAERNRIAALEVRAREEEQERQRDAAAEQKKAKAEQQRAEAQRQREEAKAKARKAQERSQLQRPQTRPLWPPFVVAAGSLLGVVLLGVLLGAIGSRLAPSPTRAPVPPDSPSIDISLCKVQLCGTSWIYNDSDNTDFQNCAMIFKPNNEVVECNTPGTYSVRGNAVRFSVNNNYAEFQGTIGGTRMSGTAKNINNAHWTWSAIKR